MGKHRRKILLAVPEMGKFTQKWYGQKWVKVWKKVFFRLEVNRLQLLTR